MISLIPRVSLVAGMDADLSLAVLVWQGCDHTRECTDSIKCFTEYFGSFTQPKATMVHSRSLRLLYTDLSLPPVAFLPFHL